MKDLTYVDLTRRTRTQWTHKWFSTKERGLRPKTCCRTQECVGNCTLKVFSLKTDPWPLMNRSSVTGGLTATMLNGSVDVAVHLLVKTP